MPAYEVKINNLGGATLKKWRDSSHPSTWPMTKDLLRIGAGPRPIGGPIAARDEAPCRGYLRHPSLDSEG